MDLKKFLKQFVPQRNILVIETRFLFLKWLDYVGGRRRDFLIPLIEGIFFSTFSPFYGTLKIVGGSCG
jgi:hypothetical protein